MHQDMAHELSADLEHTNATAHQESSDEEGDVYDMEDVEVADGDCESDGTDDGAESQTSDDDSADLEGATRMVTELAPELHNMVLEWLWQTAFCPEFVYPQIHVEYDSYICKEVSSPGGRPDLLLLSEGVMNDYEERFWSENTIVIGPGCLSYSTDFFDKIPASSRACKIDLTFSVVRDLEFDMAHCLPIDHYCWRPYRPNESNAYSFDDDSFHSSNTRRFSNIRTTAEGLEEECIPYCSEESYGEIKSPSKVATTITRQ